MITEVGLAGEILESKEFKGRFCNAIGALVRDKLNPAIPNWKEILEKKRMNCGIGSCSSILDFWRVITNW